MTNPNVGQFAVPASQLQSMLNFVSKSIMADPKLYQAISTQDNTKVLNQQIAQWKSFHLSPQHPVTAH